jgi:20S proteasome subunit beta 4
MRNGIDLSPPAVASYTRNELAKSLRKKPYQVGMLLGGIDPVTTKPSLYWIDQYASLASLPYAAQGYGLWVTPSSSLLAKGNISSLFNEETNHAH